MFDGRFFTFTGHFAFGPRKACWEVTESMGGHCRKTVLLKTDYLVVGSLISRDWKHGSFGRKIETAVQYRARRGKLAIIPEDHWASYL